MNHKLNICMKLERKTQRQIRQFRVSELELAMGSTCGCDAVEKEQEQEKREEEEEKLEDAASNRPATIAKPKPAGSVSLQAVTASWASLPVSCAARQPCSSRDERSGRIEPRTAAD